MLETLHIVPIQAGALGRQGHGKEVDLKCLHVVYIVLVSSSLPPCAWKRLFLLDVNVGYNSTYLFNVTRSGAWGFLVV